MDARILTLWGDGFHNDGRALQALLKGECVRRPDGTIYSPGDVPGFITIPPGRYLAYVAVDAEDPAQGWALISKRYLEIAESWGMTEADARRIVKLF